MLKTAKFIDSVCRSLITKLSDTDDVQDCTNSRSVQSTEKHQ